MIFYGSAFYLLSSSFTRHIIINITCTNRARKPQPFQQLTLCVSLHNPIFYETLIFQMYEKVCPTYVNNIGRARSICAEITRSLEYCFHYIRNVIAIFKSEKILFQVECLTFGVFDYIRTSSVYSVLQCYKAHDIGTFYDSIYMLY